MEENKQNTQFKTEKLEDALNRIKENKEQERSLYWNKALGLINLVWLILTAGLINPITNLIMYVIAKDYMLEKEKIAYLNIFNFYLSTLMSFIIGLSFIFLVSIQAALTISYIIVVMYIFFVIVWIFYNLNSKSYNYPFSHVFEFLDVEELKK